MARFNLKPLLVGGACMLLAIFALVDLSLRAGSTHTITMPDALKELKELGSKVEWYEKSLREKNFIIDSVNKHLNNNISLALAPYQASPGVSPVVNENNSFQPQFVAGTANNKSVLSIGIPTVYRLNGSYLMSTLESLFRSMDAREKELCTVIIMVAEPAMPVFYLSVLEQLKTKFPYSLTKMLQIVVPSESWYPDLDHLPARWGDPPFRAKWRTKQNYDYSFLMKYSSQFGQYYMQLEDDVMSSPGFVTKVLTVAGAEKGWGMIHFSPMGFIGKLFHTDELRDFVRFLLLFAKDKPVDWLMTDFYKVQGCQSLAMKNCPDLKRSNKYYKPSLFQHQGFYSSLPGKIQKIKDKGFGKQKPALRKSRIDFTRLGGPAAVDNPPAQFNITLQQYGDYAFRPLYTLGIGVFWAFEPKAGSFIEINFSVPVKLKRYRIVSGDLEHSKDRLLGASFQVLPKEVPPSDSVNKFKTDSDGYFTLGDFSDTQIGQKVFSMVDGHILPEFGLLKSARIFVHSASTNWVIIQLIQLEKAD